MAAYLVGVVDEPALHLRQVPRVAAATAAAPLWLLRPSGGGGGRGPGRWHGGGLEGLVVGGGGRRHRGGGDGPWGGVAGHGAGVLTNDGVIVAAVDVVGDRRGRGVEGLVRQGVGGRGRRDWRA